MAAELFVPLRAKIEFLIPPKSKEDYLRDLEQGTDIATKFEAMRALIHLFRAKTATIGGNYTAAIAGEVVEIFKRLALGPELSSQAAWELGAEGGNCEQVGDYQGGVWFYSASREFDTKDPELSFFRLNNLGFCLLYMKRFKAAESYLRVATEFAPTRYNAWKNLGVCLEHQGKFNDAANCYIKAITLSRGEGRSVRHLLRLADRRPEIKELPESKVFLLNFPKGKA